MALINGYKYDYAGMLTAIETLNDFHGLPVEGGVTKFSEESFTMLNEEEYFIEYDAEWTSILGEPIEVTIEKNKIIPKVNYD